MTTVPPSAEDKSGSDIEYLSLRCDEQIKYFEGRANTAKRWHQWSQIALSILAASIALTEALPLEQPLQRSIAAGIAGLILVLQTVRATKRWHENWLLFRSAEESLEREKWLYTSGSGQYESKAPAEAHHLFVTTIENLLSSSHGHFVEAHKGTASPSGHHGSSHGSS